MRIIIGADIVPTDSNKDKFIEKNVKDLVGSELLSLLQSADYRVFNLEAPLTDTGEQIEKCGSAIKATSQSINGIKALGINLLCLSNNHIMDYGKEGLNNTIRLLNENKIAYMGASLKNSWQSGAYIIEQNGVKVGFYNCCEHEFSVSKDNLAGANPFMFLSSFSDVENLKKQVDVVIVLFHGGKEYYRFPSPDVQKICRKFIECGASLVVTQHSHCIGSYEDYLDGTIVYGQGNFIFDAGDDEFWNTSILVDVEVNTKDKTKKLINVSYCPIIKHGSCISMATKKESDAILQAFFERSSKIRNRDFVYEQYSKYASEMLDSYLLSLRGYRNNFILRALNKLSNERLFKWLTNKIRKEELLKMYNYIECESHRELLLTGLHERIKYGKR